MTSPKFLDRARELLIAEREYIGGDEFISMFTWSRLNASIALALSDAAKEARNAAIDACMNIISDAERERWVIMKMTNANELREKMRALKDGTQ